MNFETEGLRHFGQDLSLRRSSEHARREISSKTALLLRDATAE